MAHPNDEKRKQEQQRENQKLFQQQGRQVQSAAVQHKGLYMLGNAQQMSTPDAEQD